MVAATTVLIAAGGTGGHVFPGMAIADELLAAGAAVVWMGAGGMESDIVEKRGLPLYTVRYQSPRRWWQLPLLLPAILRALTLLRRIRPAVVLCMGGYAAVPAGLGAWLCRIPLVIHEQNAVMGRANRLLARFANIILTGFPADNAPAKRRYIGNPVRAAFTAAKRTSPRRQSRHLLVLGGSQGAQALNEICPPAFALLGEQELTITHQCGRGNDEAVAAEYEKLNMRANVQPFIEDVAAAMAAADIVICRSGAATLAELAAAGVGAVLVPYPYAAADHQSANAHYFAECGAAIVCVQQTLTAQLLAEHIRTADAGAMAQAAATLAMPHAASEAAAICLQEARHAA